MHKKIATSTLLFGIIFLVASTAQADLVLVFEGNHDGTDASITNGEPGTITFGSASGDGTTSASYTYTISGIDAAEDGSANDSLTTTFGVTSAGGNVTFQDDGNFGVSGNGAGNLNNASESLSYSLVSSSLTLGDAGSGSVTGGGFNRIAFTVLNPNSETALLSGGTTADGTVTGNTTFSTIDTFTVGHTGDDSSFRVGPARYRFAITAATAVPEPSSLTMFMGLVGVAASRRRRNV